MTNSEAMLGPSMDRVQRTSLLSGGVLVITAIGLFIDPGQFFQPYPTPTSTRSDSASDLSASC